MADTKPTETTETEAEKEIREAQEARSKYEAAQAKVRDRAVAERDARIAPFKTFTEGTKYKNFEADIAELFKVDGVMNDRQLFTQLQTLQEVTRLLREVTAQRAGSDPVMTA